MFSFPTKTSTTTLTMDQPGTKPIFFGATQQSPYNRFSNLCPLGLLPECGYQASKFRGDTRHRFLNLGGLSEEELLRIYYKLTGKDGTGRNMWIRCMGPRTRNMFMSGIVFKMFGALPRMKGSARKKREIILADLLGYENTEQIQYAPELPDEEKIASMRTIQYERYRTIPRMKKLLLDTGNAELHEAAFRGNVNLWNYNPKKPMGQRGGDWMGKILMEVRETLRNEP